MNRTALGSLEATPSDPVRFSGSMVENVGEHGAGECVGTVNASSQRVLKVATMHLS